VKADFFQLPRHLLGPGRGWSDSASKASRTATTSSPCMHSWPTPDKQLQRQGQQASEAATPVMARGDAGAGDGAALHFFAVYDGHGGSGAGEAGRMMSCTSYAGC